MVKKNVKQEAMGLATMLGMLQGAGGMFKGLKPVNIGDKAMVLGKAPTMKGHMPAAKYAYLSDGSRIVLSGKDKGLRIK